MIFVTRKSVPGKFGWRPFMYRVEEGFSIHFGKTIYTFGRQS